MAIPFTTDRKRAELDARIEALENAGPGPVPPMPAEYYLHVLTFEDNFLQTDIQLIFSSTSAETYEIQEGVTILKDWYEDVYLNPNNKIVLISVRIPDIWDSYAAGDIQIGYLDEDATTLFITFAGKISWYSAFGYTAEEYPLILKSDTIVQI